MATETLFTAKEAAEILGVTAPTVRRYASAGLIPGVRTPGGYLRLDRRAVERMAEPAILEPRRKSA
jgi:excisionase family DNA binding protein